MTDFKSITHEQIVPFVKSWPVTEDMRGNGTCYQFSSNQPKIWEVTIYKDGAAPTLYIFDHKPPVLGKLNLQGDEA
jgi:hypothetical protein